MPLPPGARLGPYEIIAPLGAGGMGEVYRARDTRLDRTVAIKVLPPQLAADPQFRERFDREARTISQLTHPHVCTLYDVGRLRVFDASVSQGDRVSDASASQGDEVDFLVMEYLEGETLAARIERGALKFDDALRIAMEIVSALDAAHRAGVVHRDLKPANVMLTKSSAGSSSSTQAKLLDFGLAKAGASTVAGGLTMMPTTPAALTAQGTILGTFQYMAPEQIEGQEADARSDIWAFGCVLYEMLTGKRAFEAKTQATLIAAIVDRQPQPVSTIQPLTPPALDRVIAACLAKDPADRLQTAHDLLLQLRWIAEGGSAVGVPAPVAVPHRPRPRVAWAAAAILGAGFVAASAVAVVHFRETIVPVDPVQFTIAPPDKTTFAGRQLALSPDGRQLAFVVTSQGVRQIFVRPLGILVGRLLQGTDDASYPFWSADSRWLGFFAGGKLKKIQVTGGPAIVLCDAQGGRGGAWNQNNVIVFSPGNATPLMRVSAAGGEPAAATAFDKSKNEGAHRWPYFLPDGEHFVFIAGSSSSSAGPWIKVGSLASTDATTLFESNGLGGFSAGHLLHIRGRTVMAQPFDLRSLRPTGDTFPIGDNVAVDGAAFAAISGTQNGVVGYMQGAGTPTTALTWLDRGGKPIGTVLEPGIYNNLSLSPDERRLAVAIDTGTPPNRDVWTIDLGRGVPTRLTFAPGSDGNGGWSADGKIALVSNRRGPFNVFTLSSTQPGTEAQLFESTASTYAPSWSPDGRHLVFTSLSGSGTGFDVWIMPMEGDRKPYPFVQTPAQEDNAEFSPDGRWIAYSSTESNREEVYVRPFPGPGGVYQISRAGGTQPQWRGDGGELYFLGLDGALHAATVTVAAGGFEASIPQRLFETNVALAANTNRRQYAATKDGKRFLVNVPDRSAPPSPITVVLNWPAAIKP